MNSIGHPIAGTPVQVVHPTTSVIPLVCDSPHSGTEYPADFDFSVDVRELRRCEDTHVHWLWDSVPRVGGTLVYASFARSYIDPNRSDRDIDMSMLADNWTGLIAPVKRSLELGNGLISSMTTERNPIYRRLLTAAEVRHRIDCYWRPYREALARALTEASAASGPRWHLNLHSMPSNAYERLGMKPAGPLADIVLGDLHGASCDPDFVALVADAFRQHGYSVAVNDPYAGRDLLDTFGAPHRGHHSLQVEINRAIYMDETSRELLPAASKVKADLHGVLTAIAHHIRSITTPSHTLSKEIP